MRFVLQHISRRLLCLMNGGKREVHTMQPTPEAFMKERNINVGPDFLN
jgi:hypothetical protein